MESGILKTYTQRIWAQSKIDQAVTSCDYERITVKKIWQKLWDEIRHMENQDEEIGVSEKRMMMMTIASSGTSQTSWRDMREGKWWNSKWNFNRTSISTSVTLYEKYGAFWNHLTYSVQCTMSVILTTWNNIALL